MFRAFARWRHRVAVQDRELFGRAMSIAFIRGDWVSASAFRKEHESACRRVAKWARQLEYWGTDDDGNGWRVHLTRPEEK